MSDQEVIKGLLPLRHVTFFHRDMLISTDTQLSVHTDVNLDDQTFSGYMQTTVCIMHQHFPESEIQEKLVWDITRPDRSVWHIPQEKLEKLSGVAYDNRVRRHKIRMQNWYMARVEKVEPLIHGLIMQMFIDGRVTVDEIEMLVQEKYRPQGQAELIARLPWNDKEDYQL